MKHLILSTALAFPTLASGQDNAAEQEPARKFVCSMLASTMGKGEGWTSVYDGIEDGRPSLVYVPVDGEVEQDAFSEDGRYYQYLRQFRDEAGSIVASLYGTFDLQDGQLTVSRAFFATGKDSVQSSVATSSIWSCIEFDKLE